MKQSLEWIRKRTESRLRAHPHMSEEQKHKLSLFHTITKQPKICPICNKSFIYKYTHKHQKYCSVECFNVTNKGWKHTQEAKDKVSKANKGRLAKENHFNWRGGVSKEPYPFEFNHALKELIRSRDNYECQICHKEQTKIPLCVHHIDYKKNNLSINNLISLCYKCHTKTNFNREYYTKYFQNLLDETANIDKATERFKRKVE